MPCARKLWLHAQIRVTLTFVVDSRAFCLSHFAQARGFRVSSNAGGTLSFIGADLRKVSSCAIQMMYEAQTLRWSDVNRKSRILKWRCKFNIGKHVQKLCIAKRRVVNHNNSQVPWAMLRCSRDRRMLNYCKRTTLELYDHMHPREKMDCRKAVRAPRTLLADKTMEIQGYRQSRAKLFKSVIVFLSSKTVIFERI